MAQNLFYPDYYIPSVYHVDYEKLHALGIRAVLYDIDNTLVEHDAPATEQAKALFREIAAAGLKAAIISNNHEPRVKKLADAVGLAHYVYLAHKPMASGYRKACEILGVRPEEAMFFGDQIFTDILGARNAKIPCCLVKPIGPELLLKIKFKRWLEMPLLHAYLRKHSMGAPFLKVDKREIHEIG